MLTSISGAGPTHYESCAIATCSRHSGASSESRLLRLFGGTQAKLIIHHDRFCTSTERKTQLQNGRRGSGSLDSPRLSYDPLRNTTMLIRDTLPEDAKVVSVLIDTVARERRHLAATTGFSEESTESFIRFVKASNGVHLVGLVEDAIVGWCDITPASYEGMTHVGRLGMGVKAGFRGQGIGKALLESALTRAFRQGLERVELEVFRSNDSAVRLYEAHGFIREGVKVGARKLDGVADDILLFAKCKNA